MANKILILRSHGNLFNNPTGGAAYVREVFYALNQEYLIEVNHIYNIELSKNMFKKILSFLRMIFILKYKSLNADAVILDRRSMAFYRRRKGIKAIGIVHHYDASNTKNYLKKKFLKFTTWAGQKNIDLLITVSEFWSKYYQEIGYKNVSVIYNCFDIPDINDQERQNFRTKFNFNFSQPIIYCGKNQIQKGVEIVYEQLKDEPYLLITSGNRDTALPVKHMSLSYRDYLIMISCCDLTINLSIMPEGWCRTAHESLIVGTPVIGSGSGGMLELLVGANQAICKDPSELKKIVLEIINSKELKTRLSDCGIKYARSFTREKFKLSWMNEINKLILCN
jgi:glycosyltransferase involved in cell wall biosynthesis